MRIDQDGRGHTLEEDIIDTWESHGLKVTEERFVNNTWIIKADAITSINKGGEYGN